MLAEASTLCGLRTVYHMPSSSCDSEHYPADTIVYRLFYHKFLMAGLIINLISTKQSPR